jgi:hypothetical protein
MSLSIAGQAHSSISRRRLVGTASGLALAAVGGHANARQSDHIPLPPEAKTTPVDQPASQGGGPEPLARLLSFLPAAMLHADEGYGAIPWYYANIAQQFAALGLHHDADGPDVASGPLIPATQPLYLAANVFRFAFNEELVDAIGFEPLGVDQTVLAGAPPNQLSLFRGEFDTDRMEAAWEASGYERGESSTGVTTWTIGPDGEYELTNPIQSMVLATMNNLALIDGEVIVAAGTMDLLEEALATFVAGEGSAALDPDFGLSLDALPETTVSAMAVRWGSENRPDPVEGAPEMPSYTALLLGIGAGTVDDDFWSEDGGATPMADQSDGIGVAYARLVMSSAADAETALEVVEERWTTLSSVTNGQPYTDLMEIREMSVDGNIAQIDFTIIWTTSIWVTMLLSRDAIPFQP